MPYRSPNTGKRNVSYLLLATRRALLFDTGPGIYSIRDVVRGLTSLPETVIPSHLHFDHVGRIAEFSDIALIDLEALRRQVKDGEVIDLGGRRITVVNTPGHTSESVSLIDPSHQRLFTGDLVNRLRLISTAGGTRLRWSGMGLGFGCVLYCLAPQNRFLKVIRSPSYSARPYSCLWETGGLIARRRDHFDEPPPRKLQPHAFLMSANMAKYRAQPSLCNKQAI
jgi:hypothetical protein